MTRSSRLRGHEELPLENRTQSYRTQSYFRNLMIISNVNNDNYSHTDNAVRYKCPSFNAYHSISFHLSSFRFPSPACLLLQSFTAECSST